MNAINSLNNKLDALVNTLTIEQAKHLVSEMKYLLERSGLYFSLELPYNVIYRILLRKKDYQQALLYYQKSVEEAREFAVRNRALEVLDISKKYEKSQVENRLQLEKERNDQIQKQRFFWILFSIILLITLGIITYLLVTIRKKNKKLIQSNIEKDALIHEIHHRVRNNLQLIQSLIYLQNKKSNNPEGINALNDISNRISSMSMVHELLYTDNYQSSIPFKTYLNNLISFYKEIPIKNINMVEFIVQCEDISLDVRQATALGMITSEFITNSYKYAFQQVNQPRINIQLTIEDNQIHYSISDNGSGKIDTQATHLSLGMELIDIFSRQIEGDYHFESKNGLKYIVTFKKIKNDE